MLPPIFVLILILSKSTDLATQNVCKWLRKMNKEFIFIHENRPVTIQSISNHDIGFLLDEENRKFYLSEINSYWYRRGNFSLRDNFDVSNEALNEFVTANVRAEQTAALQYIHYYLTQIPNLASIFNSNVNKLEVLIKAEQKGLKTPDFLYTTQKQELKQFYDQYQNVIYKTVAPGIRSPFHKILTSTLTGKLNLQDLELLPKNFEASLFQVQIEKKYEIRSFLLEGEIHSVAIISQLNEQTKIDYRNYDKAHPNRNVPYKLPEKINTELIQLASELGLKTCSFDLIQSTSGQLYFLEVNPVGQFGNVSYHRNGYIEKKIAALL